MKLRIPSVFPAPTSRTAMTLRPLVVSLAALVVASCATTPAGDPKLAGIDTIVVIYAENHSFDNMYGMFPGADGVANATAEQKLQIDRGQFPAHTEGSAAHAAAHEVPTVRTKPATTMPPK